MARPVTLVPLACFKCDAPIPAQPEEVAWVCARCGQGLALNDDPEATGKGTLPLVVQFANGIPPAGRGKPYWVADGTVQLQRQIYGYGDKGKEAQSLWSQPRRFFIPAFDCSLETMLSLGQRMLLQPPALQPGPAAAFEPVTLHRRDIQPMADFIVLAIEAGRSDMLKEVRLNVRLSEAALWVLP